MTSDVLNVIFERRSIRQYKSTPVEKNIIESIVKAGLCAPSEKNIQPWHFLVTTDREKLKLFGERHPFGAMCQDAPAAIIVCTEICFQDEMGLWVQGLSAASQNMLLAIKTHGLGGVWITIYPDEYGMRGTRMLFGLPDTIIPFCAIPFGYTDCVRPSRTNLAYDRVHFDHFRKEQCSD